MENQLKKVYSKGSNCVASEVDDELVIVPVQNDLAEMDYLFKLNETAAFIWNHLDGKRKLEDIAGLITEEFDVDYEQAGKDVLNTIKEIEEFVEEQ